MKTCDKQDKPLADVDAKSGCEPGGKAYMCTDQTPWAVDDNMAYGFGAITAKEEVKCCQCYKLTFTSSAIKGKSMIIQATNTGGDVAKATFDIAMPGGGFGIFDACTSQWKADKKIWGAKYGGMSENMCSQVAPKLQKGCGFRWDWMQGADNPDVDYEVVDCPAEIVQKSGCSITGWTAPAGQQGVTGGVGSNSTTTGTDTTGSDTTGADTTGSDTSGSDTTGSGSSSVTTPAVSSVTSSASDVGTGQQDAGDDDECKYEL